MTSEQGRNSGDINRLMGRLRDVAPNNWWQNFIYHFTNVPMAVSILEMGALLSRSEASRLGIMATDNASQQVLGQTSDQWKNYARLYFRPKTQTQHRNEGFRPMRHYWKGAHCPMPVYFLFDSRIVLSRTDVRFSNGNLASGDSEVFESINEERILQIVSRRQSEVIVPDALHLDALKVIVCRSEAERETLLCLLSSMASTRWEEKIEIDNGNWDLFVRDWVYVESVGLSESSITLHFHLNVNTENSGPFRADLSITDVRGVEKHKWKSDNFVPSRKLVWDLRHFNIMREIILHNRVLRNHLLDDGDLVQFSLDDQIAYAGRYQDERQDLPW